MMLYNTFLNGVSVQAASELALCVLHSTQPDPNRADRLTHTQTHTCTHSFAACFENISAFVALVWWQCRQIVVCILYTRKIVLAVRAPCRWFDEDGLIYIIFLLLFRICLCHACAMLPRCASSNRENRSVCICVCVCESVAVCFFAPICVRISIVSQLTVYTVSHFARTRTNTEQPTKTNTKRTERQNERRRNCCRLLFRCIPSVAIQPSRYIVRARRIRIYWRRDTQNSSYLPLTDSFAIGNIPNATYCIRKVKLRQVHAVGLLHKIYSILFRSFAKFSL